jgi:oligopeptide/dipeptide ABC transporter ATP-binding protein
MSKAPPLLSVCDLSVSVASSRGVLPILANVSFDVPRVGAVALVGESGSGKTMTALAILSLLPEGSVVKGAVELEGRNILDLDERELCKVRGGSIGMVFQEPAAAFDPVYPVGSQIVEALRLHRDVSQKEAKKLAIEELRKVGMPAPEERMTSYPHELSGGMRQRALIAMATIAGPKLLLLDEPTTALDRTIEAQVLELLGELRAQSNTGLLLISHDLAVVAEVTEHVVVLYAGEVVERGATAEVVKNPLHPYTQALLASIPDPATRGPRKRGEKIERLPVLAGAPPDMTDLPSGCRFAPRCDRRREECDEPVALRRRDGGTREVRCVLYDDQEPPP